VRDVVRKERIKVENIAAERVQSSVRSCEARDYVEILNKANQVEEMETNRMSKARAAKKKESDRASSRSAQNIANEVEDILAADSD